MTFRRNTTSIFGMSGHGSARLQARYSTISRTDGAIIQSRPDLTKYLVSIVAGRPRLISICEYLPAAARARTALQMSVARIENFQLGNANFSFSNIAMLYGSCPLEEAALQNRRLRVVARD